MEQPAIFVERTLAIIKPDAIQQDADILRFIENHGFAILQVQRKRLPTSKLLQSWRYRIR